MSGARQAGYTIVEVTLFVAVSGLLLLVAVVGTGTTIRTIRFTDSARSLTTYVQKQYDALINGVNSRPGDISCNSGTITNFDQDVGTSNCLVMGKLLVTQTDSSEITAYNVVGTEPSNPNYSLNDETLISQFQPRVVTLAGTETYDIPWGAFVSGQERDSDNKATNAIALIRSPRSTRVVQYSFSTDETPIANLPQVVNQSATNMNKTVAVCIKSQDALSSPAKLSIGSAPNQSAVSLEFDRSDSECDGA